MLSSGRDSQEELKVFDKYFLEDALIGLGNIIGLDGGPKHAAVTDRASITMVPTQDLVSISYMTRTAKQIPDRPRCKKGIHQVT